MPTTTPKKILPNEARKIESENEKHFARITQHMCVRARAFDDDDG